MIDSVAQCVFDTLKRGLRYIGNECVSVEMDSRDDGTVDISESDGAFAIRIFPDKIGVQIYTIASRDQAIHVEQSFDMSEDDLDDPQDIAYQVCAFLLGEYVKYSIEKLGAELLGE